MFKHAAVRVFAALISGIFVTSHAFAAPSIDAAVSQFRKKVAADFQNEHAYEEFARTLESNGLLTGGVTDKFREVTARALRPEGLKGKMVNRDGMEAHHRLGLVLYGQGFAEEGHYILELYKKTRKYTPRQGLKKAQEVFDEAQKAQR